MLPVLLIYSDGCDIETSWYSTAEAAREAMTNQFEETKKSLFWQDKPKEGFVAFVDQNEAYIPADTPHSWKIIELDGTVKLEDTGDIVVFLKSL